jgi:Na+-driven multidrug efflux pump
MNARHNLVDGEISTTLISMTVPVILGMLMLFSFNLVDTFFISKLGTEALSAISFTFPLTFSILSLAIGLGIGTSAVIAKYLGRGDHEKAKQASTVTSYTSMVITLIVALAAYLFMDQIFLLLGADQSLLAQIREYMAIWLPASMLLVGIMTANSILRASGDTRTPSMVMAAAGLINAILDPILIFGIGPFPGQLVLRTYSTFSIVMN